MGSELSAGLLLFLLLTAQCDQWPQAPVRHARFPPRWTAPSDCDQNQPSFLLTLRLSAALSHQGGRQPTSKVGTICSTTSHHLEEVIKTEPTAVPKEAWSRIHLTLSLSVRDDTSAEKSDFPAVSQRVI